MWKKKAGESILTEEMQEVIGIFEGAIMIEDIQSDISLLHFAFILENMDVLVLVYDREEHLIGFIKRFGDKIKNIFVKKD